jgi:tetratricopeptide (TPR) repeat protein
VLRHYAPTWLLQLPALVAPEELPTLQLKTQGASRQRMLRELAEALEGLTEEMPLILVLEDLHWSDPSTLEALAFLARRRQPARLCILGSYRPVKMLAPEHPLRLTRQELWVQHDCQELALGALSEAAVNDYMTARLSDTVSDPISLHALAQSVHRRTEGHPLFMVAITDTLATPEAQAHRSALASVGDSTSFSPLVTALGVPETLQQTIEGQFEHLVPEEQRVLEIASVAGMEFAAALVAAGTDTDVTTVEARCAHLARRAQFVRESGVTVWPDGTVSSQFQFLHALYREVIYQRLTGGQGVRLHQRLGECQERGYGARAAEIAAELAMHFERGQDGQRAVTYLRHAADTALQRQAHREAIGYLERAMALLPRLPDGAERSRHELMVQMALGAAWMVTNGFAAPEVEQAYSRARALCQQIDDPQILFPVLMGLWMFCIVRAAPRTARELGEQLLQLAQHLGDAASLMCAHHALGAAFLVLGEPAAARPHHEEALALGVTHVMNFPVSVAGLDPQVSIHCYATLTFWFLGHPVRATQQLQAATQRAQALGSPFNQCGVLGFGGLLLLFRRDIAALRELTERAVAMATEYDFPYWKTGCTVMWGHTLVEQGRQEEGIAQIQQGLTAYLQTGAETAHSIWRVLLASAYGRNGRPAEGLAEIAKALTIVDATNERVFEAEIYRLKGTLTLQQSGDKKSPKSKVQSPKSVFRNPQSAIHNPQLEEAEACFLQAIAIARQQQVKFLELRAVTSLGRLWQQQGKTAAARQMLAEIYGWFTEGFDTPDLQEAKALLRELA